MKKYYFAGLMVFLIVLSGCTGSGTTSSTGSETKLTSYQGIDVLNFKPIKQQTLPSEQSYLELVLRNNAEGQIAKNIIISLESISPYGLLDCNGNPIPFEDFPMKHTEYLVDYNDEMVSCDKVYADCLPDETDCGFFLYDNDYLVNVTQHALSELFPGDEYDFIWGYKSPDIAIIKNIFYRHNIYYLVEYDYGISSYYNLIAMSNTEAQRRRDAGEALEVSTTTDRTAGELNIVFDTQQVYFDVLGSQIVQNFIFTLQNNGDGVLSGKKDTLLTLKVPSELDVQSGCSSWWDGHLEVMSEEDCKIELDVFSLSEDEFIRINETAGYCAFNDCQNQFLLYKTISSTEFVDDLVFYVPFKINDANITFLRQNNIPLSTYTFLTDVNYTYSLEGNTQLLTQPLGGTETITGE